MQNKTFPILLRAIRLFFLPRSFLLNHLKIRSIRMHFKRLCCTFTNRMRPSFMKGLLFSLFLLLITIAANAQSFKVYGKVTNNKLEPLAFATLQLKDQNLATSSREDGSFLFNLEVGEYNIIAQ